MLFNRGSKTPNGANGRPKTGGVPEGGYGSGGVPGKAQKKSAIKYKPMGGRKGTPAYKPSGGYGTHGKPVGGGWSKNPNSTCKEKMGGYANDGMADPNCKIPSDQKKGRFNLPKGKFTY